MLGTVRVTLPESRRMLALYVATGAAMAALAARGLTVPLYAHDLGASRFEIGALFSVSTLAAAFLSLPSGILVDRFGARAVLGISFLLSAGAQLAMAATPSVAPLFIWQVLGGLAGGAQQAALFSAVTESTSSRLLGRAMGWLTFSMQAGFFLGPSIAGIALRWIDVRTDIAVTTALLLFTIPGAIVASGTRQHTGQGLALRAPLQALTRQRVFVPLTIGLIAMTLGWGTVGAFLPVFGKEVLRLPSSQVGYLLAIMAVVNGISRLPGGRLVDRIPHRWPIVFTGVIVWSAAIAVLGHLTGFLWPAIVLVVATPFIATSFVAVGVVFANLSVSSTRGVTMGVYGTILFVGLSLGPLVFGPVVQGFGYTAGFTACAAVASLLALVMAVFHSGPVRRRSEAPVGRPTTPGT
ncbi:MAG: MFS transporter [Candidatus Dormibacteraeota bacterium]|nr:MFS transporter [Candidatus Dormibacteraeota bacterium]